MTTSGPTSFTPPGSVQEVESGSLLMPRFGPDGLIGAVVTDADTGEVLMFAWMNDEALRQTLATRQAHFWSRSRRRQWKKGEDSGNVLDVAEIRVDCDQDALWLKVRVAGAGVACHTGQRSCFYRSIDLAATAGGSIMLTR